MADRSLGESREGFYYKELFHDGKSPHQRFQWPLPDGDAPGEWVEITGKPVLCKRGFHAHVQRPNRLSYGARLFECELAGLTVTDGRKVAATKARLLREIVLEPFVSKLVKEGDRPCRQCGRVHDCWSTSNGGQSWANQDDGHAYYRESDEEFVGRLVAALRDIADGRAGSIRAREVLAVGRE